jgi:hypothetical protein
MVLGVKHQAGIAALAGGISFLLGTAKHRNRKRKQEHKEFQ